jgi:expansin (peptidoglycan-binding protein)
VENDRSVYAMVRDSCQSCQYGDIGVFYSHVFGIAIDFLGLDMSPGAFQDLASLSQGEIEVSWHFMSKDWSP